MKESFWCNSVLACGSKHAFATTILILILKKKIGWQFCSDKYLQLQTYRLEIWMLQVDLKAAKLWQICSCNSEKHSYRCKTSLHLQK